MFGMGPNVSLMCILSSQLLSVKLYSLITAETILLDAHETVCCDGYAQNIPNTLYTDRTSSRATATR
jgi:hypothetical protein